MNRTQRNGKIARLPRVVREELNQRIEDGELGDGIVRWVNELPVVREIVSKEWEGRGISEQNLSAWRNGGYRDWVEQGQVMELAVRISENAGELKDSCQPLGEMMATWVAARLMVMTKRWEQVEDEEEKWKLLRGMSVEVARFRRGEFQAEQVRTEQGWLLLEKEKLEFEREKKRKETEEERWAWAMQEENRERIAEGYMSRADKIRFIHQAYFAEVDAEPEPEIFVRERREEAVKLAKAQVREDDPGFEWYVEELVWRLKRESDERVRQRYGGGVVRPVGAPPRRQDAKGEVAGDQGRSRLVKVDQEEGLPRRHEDSKGGEGNGVGGDAGRLKGSPERHLPPLVPGAAASAELQAAPQSGTQSEVPEQEAVKADQGGSRLIKAQEGQARWWGGLGVGTKGMGNGPGTLRRPAWR